MVYDLGALIIKSRYSALSMFIKTTFRLIVNPAAPLWYAATNLSWEGILFHLMI